jgi:uncharacterized protein DUF3568
MREMNGRGRSRTAWKSVAAGICVAWLMPLCAGCVPAALATRNILEGRADASRDFRAPLDRVWPATLAALKDLGASVQQDVRDNLGGDLAGVWPGGRAFSVRVNQKDEATVSVQVRVGEMKDTEAVDSVFARIAANLR